MLKAITALIVIGFMLFGGAGATVFAAQDALPNDALYPLKTATEDLRLAFALDPQSELDLLLNYSDRRVNEIDALVGMGEDIPEDVILRLTAEMELVEEVISDLEEPELSEAIEEVGVYIWDRDRLSWYRELDDDNLHLRNLAAWTEIEECSLPEDYYELLEIYNEELAIYEAETDPDPELAPVAPLCEVWVGTGEYVFSQPGPHYYFRFAQPEENGFRKNQPVTVVISDTETISDTAVLSDTVDLLNGGGGQGQGTPMSSGENSSGLGQGQGNAADRGGDEPQKGDGANKVEGSDSQAGPNQYYNYNYPFLEFFNLPTPKAKGSGGSGNK